MIYDVKRNIRICIFVSKRRFSFVLQVRRRVFSFSKYDNNTHAYSEPCVSLTYPEPWYILITKHIQRYPRYIHNTILNIFSKAPLWTFDTVLNAPLS